MHISQSKHDIFIYIYDSLLCVRVQKILFSRFIFQVNNKNIKWHVHVSYVNDLSKCNVLFSYPFIIEQDQESVDKPVSMLFVQYKHNI